MQAPAQNCVQCWGLGEGGAAGFPHPPQHTPSLPVMNGRNVLCQILGAASPANHSPPPGNWCESAHILWQVTNSKYTAITFLPYNLYEQFKRPLNRYFLLIGLLQLIPMITPVNPITTLGPLLVAFLITAIKEGVSVAISRVPPLRYPPPTRETLSSISWQCNRLGLVAVKRDHSVRPPMQSFN